MIFESWPDFIGEVTYLPMQKLEKITPNKSSGVNSPVMVLSAF
jgi:hypothetical protein